MPVAVKMATSETVLLKSTLEIQNKPYSVRLTSSEIYWEVITSTRASGGPYSEPLVSEYKLKFYFECFDLMFVFSCDYDSCHFCFILSSIIEKILILLLGTIEHHPTVVYSFSKVLILEIFYTLFLVLATCIYCMSRACLLLIYRLGLG